VLGAEFGGELDAKYSISLAGMFAGCNSSVDTRTRISGTCVGDGIELFTELHDGVDKPSSTSAMLIFFIQLN